MKRKTRGVARRTWPPLFYEGVILMKKLILLLLALCLTFPALADSQVESQYTLEARSLDMNRYTNTMAALMKGESNYVLLSAEGEKLTDKPYLSMRPREQFYEVALEEGTNTLGLIDSEGREILPLSYGDVEVISPRWQVGVVLEEATVDNYDYKSWGGEHFYLVSAYDFFFNGAKVGSLGRTEYGSANAFGNYLYIRDKAGAISYYDSAFRKSAYEGDSIYSEYVEDYRTHAFWHPGSNQQAFTADCTLTPEDVQCAIACINNQFFDLQGNLLFSAASPYDTVSKFENGYARVRAYGKYGLLDENGREVIPCQYDEISCSNTYFGAGYQIVVKDGKVGYVDQNGSETTPFQYSSSTASSYCSPFTYLNSLEGDVIVISAAVGEIPQRFRDISMASDRDSCPVICVSPEEDKAGVMDLAGNMVIAADGTYDDTYDLSLSNDGTLVIGRSSGGLYTVYRLAHTAVESVPAAQEETVEPANVDGWACPACGTQNAGKFCTECGAARSAEGLSCLHCGYTPEGSLPKFCPECGTKWGAAE